MKRIGTVLLASAFAETIRTVPPGFTHVEVVGLEITEGFLEQTLEAFRKEIFASLHVAMPGRVVAYDAETGTATIQPAVRRRDMDGRLVTAPMLNGVPVFLPTADFMPQTGDQCMVIFADCCIDGWFDTGSAVVPPAKRMHDLADGFAIVGFRTRGGNT